jgi:PBP1b-binding outer membrane lipoprotein LpoB
MRTILLCCILLSGCSTIKSALFVAHYDNNEYALVNKVRTDAELKNCNKDGIQTMYQDAMELKNYSQYLPHNDVTVKMNNALFTLVDELHQKETFSPTYCALKLNTISKTAERIQQVIGGEPR